MGMRAGIENNINISSECEEMDEFLLKKLYYGQ
jgi:hypothetical protein